MNLFQGSRFLRARRFVQGSSLLLASLSGLGTNTGWAEYRTIDGSGNHLQNSQMGAADTRLSRFMYNPVYPGDKLGTTMLTPPDAPNARTISTALTEVFVPRTNGTDRIVNSRGLSDYVWQWGQFLTHDLDLTPNAAANGVQNIQVPQGDPYFDPLGTGSSVIPFTRSDFIIDPTTKVREQVNRVTSYVDASNVYGSDATRATALRTFQGGRLVTSDNNLPGFNTQGLPNDNQNPTLAASSLFLAGDVRANEQVGLTALHTVFLREHNRLAGLIETEYADTLPSDPAARDEEIYQRARQLVGAEMQVITYNEFLPAIMGDAAPKPQDYRYNAATDPAVTQSFAHALFRFGHSMNSPQILLVNDDDTLERTLSLKEGFWNPNFLVDDPSNVDRLLKGLAVQTAEENDLHVVDELRNFMFGRPGAGGLDLLALDIQRGRDHGLPGYVETMVSYLGAAGRKTTVDQITSDPEVQAVLTELYQLDADPKNIEKIDLFVGALAEDHIAGSLGLSMKTVIGTQFTRLRDGDRLFYLSPEANLYDLQGGEHVLKDEIRAVLDLDTVTLSDIIRLNTSITNLQDNVFFADPLDSTLPGDFDGDFKLTVADLETLADQIGVPNPPVDCDLNGDEVVDEADRKFWISQLKATHFGDSTLDGRFDSIDLAVIASRGEYRDALAENSTWASGDWDGDDEFAPSDLILAFQEGAFTGGSVSSASSASARAAVAAVPEPTLARCLLGVVTLLLPTLAHRLRRQR